MSSLDTLDPSEARVMSLFFKGRNVRQKYTEEFDTALKNLLFASEVIVECFIIILKSV